MSTSIAAIEGSATLLSTLCTSSVTGLLGVSLGGFREGKAEDQFVTIRRCVGGLEGPASATDSSIGLLVGGA